MAIFQQHLQKLISSAISEKDAVAAGIKSLPSNSVAQKLYGRDEDGKTGSAVGDALVIPYFDLEGNEIEGADGMPLERFRIFDNRTDIEKGVNKAVRYMSRSSAGNALYIPPGLKDLLTRNPSFLIVTEGEFKALCAVLHGIACAAIPGVSMWRQEAGKDIVDTRIIELANTVGRVIVLADSDATENPAVEFAMKQFATELRIQSNAIVAYASIPSYAAKAKKPRAGEPVPQPEKIGLDDWIAKNAHDTFAIVNFLSKKMDAEIERSEVLRDGGYIPLGYTDEGSVVWSVTRNAVTTMGPSNITSPGHLMQVCGGAWCDTQYADKGKTDFMKIGRDMIDACSNKGVFAEEMVRGSGVWRSEDSDDTLVISSGMDFWRTDGRVQSRIDDGVIYSAFTNIGVTKETTPATKEEVAMIYDALKGWSFTRESDPFLMLGWIAHAYLCGAWSWRTHACLTGEAGTGKSMLQTFFKNLLGKAAVAIDGKTSEPGLRQKLAKNSLAALIDEGEATGTRVAELISYLRSSSSGAEILKGSQSGTGGNSFNLRCAGLVSAVNLPSLNDTDAGRFLAFELDGAAKVRSAKSSIVRNAKLANSIGLKLFARMINSWPRINRAHELLTEIIEAEGASLRAVDTIAPPLAAGWCALNDHELTEDEARTLVASIDVSATRKVVDEVKTEVGVLDHVLGTSIQLDVDGRLERTTIADACRMAAGDGKGSPAERAIAIYGLKVIIEDDKPRLLINDKAPELIKIFKGTKFEGIALETSFKRIPGASQKRTHKAYYIGGISTKALSLPIDIEDEKNDEAIARNPAIASIVSRINA